MISNYKVNLEKNSTSNTNSTPRNNQKDQRRFSTSNLNCQSRIPIYSGNQTYVHLNNLFGSQKIKTFSHTISDLKIMDLPEHVKIHQNIHNRQNHKCQQHRTKEFCRSLPSTSGSSTPKIDESSSIMSCNSSNSKINSKKKRNIYEEYLPLCEMQKGLQKGEIVEGVLRINQRNYNDAYISAPDEGLDIFINGLLDRNKALNGDLVAAKLYDKDKWKISFSAINLNWNEWQKDFQKLIEAITIIDLKNLTLNSKDRNAFNLSLASSKNTEEALKNEFPNLPIEVFALQVEDLTMKISYWPKFTQRSGKVVSIVEANHPRIFAGTLKFNESMNKKSSYVMFTSCDQRNPQVIIPNECIPSEVLNESDVYLNHLFLVKITEWKSDSLYPNGQVLKSFGKCGNIESETEVVLITNKIDTTEFPQEVLEYSVKMFGDEGWRIPDEETLSRKDLRQECIFTIDPETAKDLDDAVSFKNLSDDRFEVGVHIADVSYFIPEDSLLDQIAKKRGTSVYLVSKVIPMLPHIFCQDLCSLNPGQDKLTFSVIFTMDNEGKILDRWFGRTIINSCCKLSYEHAQRFIEYDTELDDSRFPECFGKWSLNDVGLRVRALNQIAQKLRTKRFESGSLNLIRKKTTFLLDDEGLPIALTSYPIKDSNKLIEELMLMANKAVAELLYDNFAKEGRAFLRKHPPIQTQNLTDFMKFIRNVASTDFQINSSLAIKKSLDDLEKKDKVIFQISSLFLIRSMMMAEYCCVDENDEPEKYHHYALNFDKYTHFTSPIRRYPDIIVHRLLSTILGYNTACSKSREKLKKICQNCNMQKYNAYLTSEKSREIYLKAYISKIRTIICKAVVMQVYDRSFDILILDFDLVQRVYADQLDIEKYEFNKNQTNSELILKWTKSEDNSNNEKLIQSIKNFDSFDVELFVTKKFEFKAIIAHPNGKFIHKVL